MNTFPENPLQAVTHPDPYPYYRDLAAQRPLYFDEDLKLWNASGASEVQAILNSDLCRVRPAAEPVPKALLNSQAADIFGHLVRMIDGSGQIALKNSVSRAIGGVDLAGFRQISALWAETLFARLDPGRDPARLSDFAFSLSAYVMGDLLGIPGDQLDAVAAWVKDFVRCLSPLSSSEQLDQGKLAAGYLRDLFRSLIPQSEFFSQFSAEAAPELVIANGIGFLSQAYEATAGLIGNTIVNLARHPEIFQPVKADLSLLPQVIQEVLRYDPPVQNTRRWVAGDGIIAGSEMKAGAGILVILAAANHDPAANPAPERFDISRQDRQIFTFGSGHHACPGPDLAAEMAHAAIMQWITGGAPFSDPLPAISYQVSVNVRIPLFGKDI